MPRPGKSSTPLPSLSAATTDPAPKSTSNAVPTASATSRRGSSALMALVAPLTRSSDPNAVSKVSPVRRAFHCDRLRPDGAATPERRKPRIHGASEGPGGCAEWLLDEEHLLVLRQRPEVVGDDALEAVGDGADAVHRR